MCIYIYTHSKYRYTWISDCKERKWFSFSHTAADALSYLPSRLCSDLACPTSGMKVLPARPRISFPPSSLQCILQEQALKPYTNTSHTNMYVSVHAVFGLHGVVKMLATIIWPFEYPHSFGQDPQLFHNFSKSVFLGKSLWFSTCLLCLFRV